MFVYPRCLKKGSAWWHFFKQHYFTVNYHIFKSSFFRAVLEPFNWPPWKNPLQSTPRHRGNAPPPRKREKWYISSLRIGCLVSSDFVWKILTSARCHRLLRTWTLTPFESYMHPSFSFSLLPFGPPPTLPYPPPYPPHPPPSTLVLPL